MTDGALLILMSVLSWWLLNLEVLVVLTGLAFTRCHRVSHLVVANQARLGDLLVPREKLAMWLRSLNLHNLLLVMAGIRLVTTAHARRENRVWLRQATHWVCMVHLLLLWVLRWNLVLLILGLLVACGRTLLIKTLDVAILMLLLSRVRPWRWSLMLMYRVPNRYVLMVIHEALSILK